MGELEGIKSFLFIDEVKNSTSNEDLDNSFYYFAIVVPQPIATIVRQQLLALISYLPNGFHAKNLYKAKSINLTLMNSITDLMVRFKLIGICYRYDRDLLYNRTLTHLQPHIKDGEMAQRMTNWEYQAFFYFIQNLHHIPARTTEKITYPVCCFIDRGIYGVKEIEGIDFVNENLIKRAVFVSRTDMLELALPDHLGYIFSKCRNAYLPLQPSIDVNTILESTPYGQQLSKLTQNGLFCYIEAEDWFDKLVEK